MTGIGVLVDDGVSSGYAYKILVPSGTKNGAVINLSNPTGGAVPTFMDDFNTIKANADSITNTYIVGNLIGAKGFIYNCFLYGTITIIGDTTIAQCSVAVNAPSRKAFLNFNGIVCTVLTSGWASGVLGITGMVTSGFAGVSGTGGRVAIELANAGGELVYSGGILLNAGNEDTLTSITNTSTAGIVLAGTKVENKKISNLILATS